ncbi:SH3 domain-containing protein [Streptosporangium carneum]|uniref:SH3 domain-containing protein n=1 Tax=Streptosporangium carneum TaxID=47481 RepID=A0A9W6I8L9_9ACTN|nr:SH3 domain-containing protein [Streptosporangium carneum]GLK13623.1 hypothetical protein GCM10017600_70340 [Streptosporangium carneum]
MKSHLALLVAASAVVAGTLTAVGPAQAAVSAALPSSPLTSTSAFAYPTDAVVTGEGLRLRSAPGGGWIIGYLYPGDYGQILNTYSSAWCRFRLGGRSASGLPAGTTGWASCSYLATEDGLRVSNTDVDPLGP